MKSCTMEKIILCLTYITAVVAIPFKPYPVSSTLVNGVPDSPGGYVVTSAKYSNDDKSCSNFATMQSLTYVPINTCIVADAAISAPSTGFSNGANNGQSYAYFATTVPYSSSNANSNTTVVWISTWNGVTCGTNFPNSNSSQSIVDYRPLRTTCQCSGGSCQSNNYYVKKAPLPPATYSGNYITTT